MDESVDRQVRLACPAEADSPSPAVAGNRLTETLRDRLVRLAYRFLWNLDDAEDVVHDALTTAHQRAPDLRDGDKWWSWVCRIVVRGCHQHGRNKQRKKRHQDPYEREVLRRAGDDAPDGSLEGQDCVRELIKELPRRQREVMVLRHLQDMAYGEIAEVLDISAVTARVHARAGRETLRSLLLQRHPDWFDRSRERGGVS